MSKDSDQRTFDGMAKQQLAIYARELQELYDETRRLRAELEKASSRASSMELELRGSRTITEQRDQLEELNLSLARSVEERVHELRESYERLRQEIEVRAQTEEKLREANERLEVAVTALKQTEKQAAQQERLRALGQMATGIAHDFNNALSPILTYSSMLLEPSTDLEDKDQLIDDIKMIHTATRDAGKVVQRLREFYRESDDGDETEAVDLNEQVRTVIGLTRPRWMDEAAARGANINIEEDLGEIEPVTGNASQIREALTNLILNAADAIPDAGTISFRSRAEDKHVILELSDTGVGMPEDVVDKCMDPFFSTKGEMGTGMGLAMVYGIMQRHNGEYEITSEVGKGTTFTIRLPINTDEGEPKQTEPDQDQEASRPGHILIVDDDPMGLRALQGILTADGHSVEVATDGRDGLEKFRAGRFDLVVTDRAMPHMGGDQLAYSVKELAPNQPIIMITGFGDIMAASGEKPPNVDALVSKPIDPKVFRGALRQVLEPR